jgi:UrcA family protein
MLRPLSALAVTLIASAYVPAAGQADAPRSVRVSYADLNLGNAVGQQVRQHRNSAAAGDVCATAATPLDLKMTTLESSCLQETIASVQPAYEAAINSARHGSVTVLDGAALIISAQ